VDLESWWNGIRRLAQNDGVLLYAGGAAITGVAAALHLAINHPPTVAKLSTPNKP